MAVRRTSKVTRKGQITLPAELRRDLDLQEGDTVIFSRTERGIEVFRPTDAVVATAGIFAQYAKNVPTDPGELRNVIAESIAADVAREMDEM